ncbi:MAG: ABC transporter ATP-binding protein [Anaerolineales bacterium]|jgi:ABC-2 type transport system ATP-binding protein|nr:ABC transporter ATP-binding protein [Anaerolineales bacterium]
MTEQLAIQTHGLIKNYGNVRALRGVDLEVRQGEIFGFLGPNGAGKTTTIRCMLDLIRPNGGTLRVMGYDPQEDPVSVRSLTGYLPGELSMESNLRVESQYRYLSDLRGNTIDWNFVRELARRLDLDLTLPIKNLSKGNKQKVGVVQALMSRPKLLLMDEPTSGLDPLMQQEVYRLLREAKADGTTTFFSSHIITEVEAIADRVAIIRKGVIVEEAEPSQLLSMEMRRIHVRFKEPVNPSLLDQVDGISLLSQRNGLFVTLQVEGEMDGIIKALAAFPVVDIDVDKPTLEEIFLAYYAADDKEVS